jgi:hypothetical protein
MAYHYENNTADSHFGVGGLLPNFEYVCYGDHKNAIFFCISSSLRDIKYKQLEQEHSFILLFYIKKLSHNDFRE